MENSYRLGGEKGRGREGGEDGRGGGEEREGKMGGEEERRGRGGGGGEEREGKMGVEEKKKGEGRGRDIELLSKDNCDFSNPPCSIPPMYRSTGIQAFTSSVKGLHMQYTQKEW